MQTERMAFEAWLVRRAMRQVFSDEQVADLRMAFNAGWTARDAEFVAPEAQDTISVADDDRATTRRRPPIVRSGSAGMIVCDGVAGWASRVSKILVIDDDGTVRAVLAALLGKFGYEAVLASNTIDGIAAAESGSIDVALIDMNMPGLDGLEAVKAISNLETRIPIIGMSAGSATTSAEDYAVLAANLGAALFLPKPFDGANLQAAIKTVSASRSAR